MVKKINKNLKNITHNDVPASVGLVKEVRDELRAEIRVVHHEIGVVNSKVESVRNELRHEMGSLRNEMGSLRSELHHEIGSLRSELHHEIGSLRSELHNEIGSLRHELGTKIDKVLVSVHQTQVLMEEQRGENRIVLDGLKNVIERQDRMDGDILEIKDTLKSFKNLKSL